MSQSPSRRAVKSANKPLPKAAAGPRLRKIKAPPKVGFVSLGCPKALVDSERIITRLRAEGYQIAPNYDGADVVVSTNSSVDAPRSLLVLAAVITVAVLS